MREMETSIAKAVRIVGGHVKAAKICDVSRQSVYFWTTGKYRVSGKAAMDFEQATERVVTRHDLRPDLYPLL